MLGMSEYVGAQTAEAVASRIAAILTGRRCVQAALSSNPTQNEKNASRSPLTRQERQSILFELHNYLVGLACTVELID